MMRVPIIIASDRRPVKSGGGPAGIAYRLLKGLMGDPRFVLYFLSASEARLWKLEDISDIDTISLEFYPSLGNFRNFRIILRRFYFLRTLYHFYKYKASILHPRSLKMSKLINNILAGQKGVLHLQNALPTAIVPDSILTQKNLRVVWTEHSKGGITREWEQLEGHQVRKLLSYQVFQERYSFLIDRCDRIVFPSWGAVNLFESYNCLHIPRDKLAVIYNGVEDPFKQNGNPISSSITSGLFVTVAEHVPEKGLDIALEGLTLLKRDWRWCIIGGTTDWTNTLVDKAYRMDVLNHIQFLGRLPHRQVLELVAKAEAVIMTQRVAVFDLAIIEAMALGKAIFATPVGGNVEALGEAYPLFINSPEDLSRAIEAMSHKDLQRIGERNRERYQAHFTKEAMVNSYAMVYIDLGL